MYEKRKGGNYMNRREKEEFLLMVISQGISVDANKLKYSLAVHGAANCKECL